MGSIYAVAVNTIKQALRMKVALVFIILLLVLLPVMGIAMPGDGTLKGRLQTFVSYGLSLTSLLLCLVTIIVSVYSLASDLNQKQIYTVLTKPIRRYELIFGKLLGVLLLDIFLLVVFSGLIYGITCYIPQFTQASVPERIQAENEFFTARMSLTPAPIDVNEEVTKAFKKLEKEGQFPPEIKKNKTAYGNFIAELTRQKKLASRAAAPGSEIIWDFHNVKPADPNQTLFIRFKYDVSVTPPDSQISGKWLAADIRQFGSKVEPRIYKFDRKDGIGSFYEIQVPANAVADDGYLAVVFFNDPQFNNTIVIFPPEDGLELLYKADTFYMNFIKSVIMIFFRLLFLAVLGVLASTFLSFPVAILLCLVIFFTGTISGFIIESIDSLGETISRIYFYTVKPIVCFCRSLTSQIPQNF